jgi:D-alanyl-D-alanine carboxypeptidase (penicillin-binding protein 5/6)
MKDSQSLKKKQKKFIKKENRPVSPPPKRKSLPSLKVSLPALPRLPRLQIPGIKEYERDLAMLLIPLMLFVVFLTLVFINNHVLDVLSRNTYAAFPVDTKINPYPFVQEVPLLSLTAKSALIVNADSQVVVFSKNPELRFSMASTTKIMTALVALDYYKDNSVLTIQTFHVEGAGLGLQIGDQFFFEDLMYAMLLPSANDAAVAIADNYPGGKDAFVAKMNEKAQQLHLSDTHFSDPTGLEDDGDYTTVTDMAHLAAYAIQNAQFSKVTGTRQKVITNITKTRRYELANLNKLLGENGITGIKTGTTEGAGEVLVTSLVAGGHTYIIVVMNSTDRFADTGVLLNFIAKNVQYVDVEEQAHRSNGFRAL